jgi:hypothetical protein
MTVVSTVKVLMLVVIRIDSHDETIGGVITVEKK